MGDEKHYLIVEDEDSVARLYARFAERWGYIPVIATLGDAREKNRNYQPKVVQLDGLEGLCFEIHDALLIDNPDAIYLLVSGTSNYFDLAKGRNIRFFDKVSGSFQMIKAFLDTQTQQHAETNKTDELQP